MSVIHSQSSSDALIVISMNIEGLTANKPSILSELCKDNIATVYVSKKPTEPKIIVVMDVVWHRLCVSIL